MIAAVRLGHQEVAAAGARIGLQPNGDEIGDAAVDGDRHRGLADGADVGGARTQRLDHRGAAAEVRELHAVRGVLACVGEVPRQRLRGVLLGDDELGAGGTSVLAAICTESMAVPASSSDSPQALAHSEIASRAASFHGFNG